MLIEAENGSYFEEGNGYRAFMRQKEQITDLTPLARD